MVISKSKLLGLQHGTGGSDLGYYARYLKDGFHLRRSGWEDTRSIRMGKDGSIENYYEDRGHWDRVAVFTVDDLMADDWMLDTGR